MENMETESMLSDEVALTPDSARIFDTEAAEAYSTENGVDFGEAVAVVRGRARARSRRKIVQPEDLLAFGIQESLVKLATKMRRTAPTLVAHEVDDLVQAAMERALERLHTFEGRSSLKTWVCAIARCKFIDMSRRAKIRPTPGGEIVEHHKGLAPRLTPELRERFDRLYLWLKDGEGRDVVPEGHAVLTLLVNRGANWDHVSAEMTSYTRQPWTARHVRTTVRQIKRTDQGRVLCEVLGAPTEDDDEEAA